MNQTQGQRFETFTPKAKYRHDIEIDPIAYRELGEGRAIVLRDFSKGERIRIRLRRQNEE